MKNFLKEVFSTILTLLIVLGAFWVVQKVVVQPFKVEGQSMDYTLANGERMLMWKLADIERFDVVVVQSPVESGKMYVKRVIGLPGDTLEVKDDKLILNGQALDEPYLAQKQAEATNNFTKDFTLESITGQTVIPEGKVFVMGDNRQNSLDGRGFGFIGFEDIVGEADMIYWPFNKVGFLTKYKLNDDGTAIIER